MRIPCLLKFILLGFRNRDSGHAIENVVYFELLRRGYDVAIGKADQAEVDFIATTADDKLYVQITYLLASPETIDQEFRIYNSIQGNFPKYAVSLDEFNMSHDGINHRNIR